MVSLTDDKSREAAMVEIVMKSREWQGPTKAITVGLSFLVQGLLLRLLQNSITSVPGR